MKLLRANTTYNFDLNGRNPQVPPKTADGVTIEIGARCSLTDVSGPGPVAMLVIGQVVTLIKNTAATPISGTFSNLPDGSTVVVGINKYQVSYSGGEGGNDLTLTALPPG